MCTLSASDAAVPLLWESTVCTATFASIDHTYVKMCLPFENDLPSLVHSTFTFKAVSSTPDGGGGA